MPNSDLLEQSWVWRNEFMDRFFLINTFDEWKQLERERQQWYKNTMPKLKDVDPAERKHYAEVLSVIFGTTDLKGWHPEDWAPEELAKWKQKYDGKKQ